MGINEHEEKYIHIPKNYAKRFLIFVFGMFFLISNIISIAIYDYKLDLEPSGFRASIAVLTWFVMLALTIHFSLIKEYD